MLIRYSGLNVGSLSVLENSCSHMWVRPKSDGMTDVILKWGIFVFGEKGPTCKGLEKRCDQIILQVEYEISALHLKIGR